MSIPVWIMHASTWQIVLVCDVIFHWCQWIRHRASSKRQKQSILSGIRHKRHKNVNTASKIISQNLHKCSMKERSAKCVSSIQVINPSPPSPAHLNQFPAYKTTDSSNQPFLNRSRSVRAEKTLKCAQQRLHQHHGWEPVVLANITQHFHHFFDNVKFIATCKYSFPFVICSKKDIKS